MPGAKISGIALAEGLAGFVLLWSGLTNATLQATITGLLKGQPPALGSNPETPPTAGVNSNAEQQSDTTLAAPSSDLPAGGGGSDSANQTLGQLMAGGYGWGSGDQWTALQGVVAKESGWNNQIYNGGTVGGPYQPNKAYGIAQALGHGPDGAPYPSSYNAANPPGAGGSSSATTQIAWMLAYIKSAYGTPEAALAHENSAGWY